MTEVRLKLYRMTQTRTYEYGRLSALPKHAPTHIRTEEVEYLNIVPYVSYGSAFMTDPEDEVGNMPAVYVTFGECKIELTDIIVEIDECQAIGQVVFA